MQLAYIQTITVQFSNWCNKVISWELLQKPGVLKCSIVWNEALMVYTCYKVSLTHLINSKQEYTYNRFPTSTHFSVKSTCLPSFFFYDSCINMISIINNVHKEPLSVVFYYIFLILFYSLHFDHVMQLMQSQFPNQGLNSAPWQ